VPLSAARRAKILENVQDADWTPDGSSLAVTRWAGTRSRLEYPDRQGALPAAGLGSDVRVSADGRLVFRRPSARGNNDGCSDGHDTEREGVVQGPFPAGRRRDRPAAGAERASCGRAALVATSLTGAHPASSGRARGVVHDVASGRRVP
jgi:hypothetical protein